jgi:hypothetical protein
LSIMGASSPAGLKNAATIPHAPERRVRRGG